MLKKMLTALVVIALGCLITWTLLLSIPTASAVSYTRADSIKADWFIDDENNAVVFLVNMVKGNETQVLGLSCSKDEKEIGLAHNFKNNGVLIEDGTEFVIYAIPKNITNESTDSAYAIFSSAEGELDILGAFSILDKVPDTHDITFGIEDIREDGTKAILLGTSYTVTGKQWKKATRKIKWDSCDGIKIHSSLQYIEPIMEDGLVHPL